MEAAPRFYLVPNNHSQYIVHLSRPSLWLRPYHLHDFARKKSALLVEVKAIEGLSVRSPQFGALAKKKQQAGRNSMFAYAILLTPTRAAESKSRKAKLPSPGAANRHQFGDPIAEHKTTSAVQGVSQFPVLI